MSEVAMLGSELSLETNVYPPVPEPMDEVGQRLEAEFCQTLHAWDRHVDGCAVCLTQGSELCDRGWKFSYSMARKRQAIVSHASEADEPEGMDLKPRILRRAWIVWASLIALFGGQSNLQAEE